MRRYILLIIGGGVLLGLAGLAWLAVQLSDETYGRAWVAHYNASLPSLNAMATAIDGNTPHDAAARWPAGVQAAYSQALTLQPGLRTQAAHTAYVEAWRHFAAAAGMEAHLTTPGRDILTHAQEAAEIAQGRTLLQSARQALQGLGLVEPPAH